MTGPTTAIQGAFLAHHQAQLFRAGTQQISLVAWPYSSDPDVIAGCKAMLRPSELRRANRLKAPSACATFVQRRAFIGWLIHQQAQTSAPQTSASRSPAYPFPTGGRPPQHFSVTSTASHALVAIAQSPGIGVDIEAPDDTLDVEDLARGLFSPGEEKSIADAAPEQAAPIFYRLWRLKEAGLKYLGLGLSDGINRFQFLPDGQGDLRVVLSPQRTFCADRPVPRFYECRFSGFDVALALPGQMGSEDPWRVAKATPWAQDENGVTTDERRALAV